LCYKVTHLFTISQEYEDKTFTSFSFWMIIEKKKHAKDWHIDFINVSQMLNFLGFKVVNE
jgi:hypothetical protein